MTTTNVYIEILYKKYNTVYLGRKEVAEVFQISLTSLDNLISNGQLPIRYKRIGKSQKARYVFPLVEVANYLAFSEYAA